MNTHTIAALEHIAVAKSQQGKHDAAATVWKMIDELQTQQVMNLLSDLQRIEADLMWALQHGTADSLDAQITERKEVLRKLAHHAEWMAKELQRSWYSNSTVVAACKTELNKPDATP